MRPRREVPLSLPSTIKNLEITETSILASLSERHRITKSRIKFDDLTIKDRKQFYKEVVDHVVGCSTKNLTMFKAAMRVALSYKIVVANCDRGSFKTIAKSRLAAAKAFNYLFASIPSEAHAIPNEEGSHGGEKRRRGASTRRDV